MAGRKRIDDKGEKRTEKLMCYVTSQMNADIQDFAHLQGTSTANFINEILAEYISTHRKKLEAFRDLRKNA